MNIILFGPPGAGKGTQANKLSKDFKLFKVSAGDLLRDEIKKKSSLGKEIETIINSGMLVPDVIINNLIEQVASNPNYHNQIIFDGYPRNLSQVHSLEKILNQYKQKILCVLNLDVDIQNITKRVLGRKICSRCGLTFNDYFNPPNKKNYECELQFLEKRADDSEKVLKKRYDTYQKEIATITSYYKKKKLLYKIDGKGDISQIYEQIRLIIGSLNS